MAQPYFHNYDPLAVVVVYNGVQLQGYAVDSFVKVSRDASSFKLKTGAGGDYTRSLNRNRAGKIVVMLDQASPSNDLLSAMQAIDEATGQNSGEVLVKDLNGTTLATSENAWLDKPADAEFAAEAKDREWTIACAPLAVNIGGSLV